MTREMKYPRYEVTSLSRDDIALCFVVPGAKFGAVEVVLDVADAVVLAGLLDKAVGERAPDRSLVGAPPEDLEKP